MADRALTDRRDPELLAVELLSLRRPGETLSQAAERLDTVDIPDYGTRQASEYRAKLNGHLSAVNAALKPRRV